MASFEARGTSTRAIVWVPKPDGSKGKLSKTFDTLAQAKSWATLMERKAELSSGSAPAGVSNAEMFEAYLDDAASKTDTAKWNRYRIMNWMSDPLAAIRVGETTTHDINQWITRRLATKNERTGQAVTPATVNRELNLMSGAFNYAKNDRQWIAVNPCHGVRRPERGRPKKRQLLTPDEIRAIRASTGFYDGMELTTLTSRVGACFLLALETGMRSGEILRIRPKDYWRSKQTVHVAAIEVGGRKASQSGRSSADPSRNVPLTPRAIELLDQLLRSMPKDQKPKEGFTRPPYIVGIDDRQRDALWRKARDQAGVEELTFHHTKHEAATRLARHLDAFELSHAIGTKDIALLRDTYYESDASRAAKRLPHTLHQPDFEDSEL